MKKPAGKFGLMAAAALAGFYATSLPTQAASTDVLSTNGIHWHPKLEIYVKGVPKKIPANIGIGPRYASDAGYDPQMGMTTMHTHKDNGTIHLEIPGTVTHAQTTLGAFFKIWGKSFDDFGSRVIMTVNGKKNTEGLNYEMKDGDKIILSFFP